MHHPSQPTRDASYIILDVMAGSSNLSQSTQKAHIRRQEQDRRQIGGTICNSRENGRISGHEDKWKDREGRIGMGTTKLGDRKASGQQWIHTYLTTGGPEDQHKPRFMHTSIEQENQEGESTYSNRKKKHAKHCQDAGTSRETGKRHKKTTHNQDGVTNKRTTDQDRYRHYHCHDSNRPRQHNADKVPQDPPHTVTHRQVT